MEKYRKLKVIGKGSFGYAVLVQSVADRQTYVMKVTNRREGLRYCRSLMCQRWTESNAKTLSMR